jgi:hypothetical protein
VRYSFNLNAELGEQPKASHTKCENENQQKREGRNLGSERARYWVFINILWLKPSPRKCRFLANIYTLQKVMISKGYQSPTSPLETGPWIQFMASLCEGYSLGYEFPRWAIMAARIPRHMNTRK